MLIVCAGYTAASCRGVWSLWVRPRIGDIGTLINVHALWIGVHYSPANHRWCINLVPCFTLWITKPQGKVPDRAKL